MRPLGAALALAVAGCRLTDVSLATPDDVVVVEGYVRVGEAPGLAAAPSAMSVFLHRTLELDSVTADPPPADVTVRRPADGRVWRLGHVDDRVCVFSRPVIVGGTCYAVAAADAADLRPGDRLTLEVALADGRFLQSETRVPGAFHLLDVAEGDTCALAPRTSSELRWTRSDGAWAYLAETFVRRLPAHFDVEVDDPLYLLGLSVSAADTTVVFPGELGVFARADLEREVSVYLQQGLPPGTSASVTVAAVERNWANWARGGSFNPSGQVRVPSVRGDGGTGVFGAGVVRPFAVAVPDGGRGGLPACPPPPG